MQLKSVASIVVMYICFIIHYMYDERLLVDYPELKRFRSVLPLICYMSNTLFAVCILLLQRGRIFYNPIHYLPIAVFMFLGILSANSAKEYVDYATLNVMKSAKPLSIMLLSITVFRKPVPMRKIVMILILSLGLIIFGFSGDTPSATKEGLFLVTVSLLCDAIYIPFIDILKSKSSNSYATMLYSYGWECLISLLIGYDSVRELFRYILSNKGILFDLALFALTGSIAQVALFTALDLSNGLVVSIATTTRKFFTILISSIYYHHAFTVYQWVGIAIVFFSLFIETLLGKIGRREKPDIKKD